MSKDYSSYLDKLVHDSITQTCQSTDILCGMKEISGKLDTLIALKQAELSLLQQRQEPLNRKEQLSR